MTQKITKDFDFRRFLRLTGILLISGILATLFSSLLLHLGLKSMWLRYGISYIALYSIFILLVWKYLVKVANRLIQDTNEVKTEPKKKSEGSQLAGPSIPDELIGHIGLAFAILVILLLFVFNFVLIPIFLVDLAFVEALVISVALKVKKTDATIPLSLLFKKTWIVGLVFLFLAMLMGFLLSLMFPKYNSIGEIVLGLLGIR